MGALNGRDTDVLWQALPFIAVGGVLALLLGPSLNALALGDDIARGLGQRVVAVRLAAAASVVLLCGAATAVAGPIGFLGLAVAGAHPEFEDKTITLGSRTASAWGAYVRGTGRVDFVERLGFRNNPAVEAEAGSAFSVPVSEENLNLLDADLTVMAPIGVTAKKISSDPLFKAVPSVEKGHSVVFDDADISQAFAMDSVLSVDYALEKVVPLFSKALKS